MAASYCYHLPYVRPNCTVTECNAREEGPEILPFHWLMRSAAGPRFDRRFNYFGCATDYFTCAEEALHRSACLDSN